MQENTPARPQAVLIGTPDTLLALRSMLVTVEAAPEAIGCLVVGPSESQSIAGVPVLGSADEIVKVCELTGFALAVVCLPRSMDAERAQISADLAEAGIGERFVPPLEEVLTEPAGREHAPAFHPVRVGGADTPPAATGYDPAALIGREPNPVDGDEIASALGGRRVLITGAGGSIGSELARQAARYQPESLILMERSENALFEIDRQIARLFPDLPRVALLHDVADETGTARQLERLRPHAVYHAAAHKHVPLMEDHPAHAVRNNLFGTRAIADATASCGAERFVLISSDKAVNPTSVMGATKRLAERYVQGIAEDTSTRMSMVRFGNVLGSAGSVVPIWSAQLGEGGPVTVTDPRMTRYFMTIPEAASLVLQASVIPQAEGVAAVYELDMGDAVNVLALAERFCRLNGYAPRVIGLGEEDRAGRIGAGGNAVVDVVITGARPGEKLHEELAYEAEEVRETGRPGVRAWAGETEAVDTSRMTDELAGACDASDRDPDPAAVLGCIRRWVPEMRPDRAIRRSPVTRTAPIAAA
ncbi:MAG: polysaccharide biosynthesis protein [Planctomycetota bacterium]